MAPGTPGSGYRGPCPSNPGQPRAPRPSPGSPPGPCCQRKDGVPVAEGRRCSSFPCPLQRRCLCVRACVSPRVRVPACVSPRVPACAPCLHAGAACVALQRAGCAACAGSAAAPAPRAGRGERTPPTPPPPLRAGLAGFSPVFPAGTAGGKCQLRRSTAMCLSPLPALTACFSFGSVLLPLFRRLRLLEVRDLQTRAPTESGGWGRRGITPINTKHAPACQNRDENLTSFLSNDRTLQVIWPGG